jgi:UDP-N-acetyl-D-glucosamine dehydrogenase
MNLLEHSSSGVSFYDPFVPVIRPTREHSQWAGTESVKWSENILAFFALQASRSKLPSYDRQTEIR